jgi:hypothetical protein
MNSAIRRRRFIVRTADLSAFRALSHYPLLCVKNHYRSQYASTHTPALPSRVALIVTPNPQIVILNPQIVILNPQIVILSEAKDLVFAPGLSGSIQ